MTSGVCRECWSKEVNGDVDQSDGLFYCVASWYVFDDEQQKGQCNMTDRLLSSGGKKWCTVRDRQGQADEEGG